jgi:hypothetical protein
VKTIASRLPIPAEPLTMGLFDRCLQLTFRLIETRFRETQAMGKPNDE